jgi:hypothetical protein
MFGAPSSAKGRQTTVAIVLAVIVAVASIFIYFAFFGSVTPLALTRSEAFIGGGESPRRLIRLETTSADASDALLIFPGVEQPKMAIQEETLDGTPPKSLLSGPFEPGNPYPAIKLLGRIITIEPEQLVIDGQHAADLRSVEKELRFAERGGEVEVTTSNGVRIARFKR